MEDDGATTVVQGRPHVRAPCPAQVHRVHSEGVDALMYAASGGHLATVDVLVARGADVAKKHLHGGSAFLEAATAGSVAVMERLQGLGADPLVVDDDGVTALMSAASQGMTDATAYLLAVPGTQLDLAAQSGGTALMFAAAGGHLGALKLTIDAGGDVNKKVVGTEAYVAQVAAQLAEGKEDVEPHKDGVTALQVAAQGGHLACVELLLDSGADPRPVDEEGMSALANAVAGNHGDCAYALVDRGADPDDRGYVDGDAVEHNLLWDAINARNEAFATLLLAKGAAVDYADAKGVGLVLAAAHKGLNATVEALLGRGADAAKANDEGVDALLAAASEGHAAVVALLLAHLKAKGQTLGTPDGEGTSPLMAAAVRGHVQGRKRVIQRRFNVGGLEATPERKHPCFKFALRDDRSSKNEPKRVENDQDTSLQSWEFLTLSCPGHVAIVDQLVAAGADVNWQNAEGHSALFFAYNGKNQVMSLRHKYYNAVVGAADAKKASASTEAELAIIDAAVETHVDTVAALLKAGADPKLKSNEGHLAADFDYVPPDEAAAPAANNANGEL